MAERQSSKSHQFRRPPSGAARVMIHTADDGMPYAVSSERVEVIIFPPLVLEPTLISSLRVGANGEVLEQFAGKQWKAVKG